MSHLMRNSPIPSRPKADTKHTHVYYAPLAREYAVLCWLLDAAYLSVVMLFYVRSAYSFIIIVLNTYSLLQLQYIDIELLL